ncbi:MAG TPA: alpha/beta hydrolase, partial [Solirubrobacterales bacterium]|nr:alpha/beta hydrolase [Solirubrobacterales bacterium]
MPLDDQTSAFLETSRAKPSPSPDSMTLEDFRGAVEPFRALGFEREEVGAVHDLSVAVADNENVPVRLYVPDVEEAPPIVVWAHGGSWVRVTVDLLENHFRVYANRSGCAIAAVDYHLAPESRFPRAVEEVVATGRWANREGAELGCDPSRIAVAGESSGGNLAAAATLLDASSDEPLGFAHQTLIAPVIDTRFETASWDELGTDYLLTRAQLEWALDKYAPAVDPSEPLLSPIRAASHAGLPPALIVTGEYDPLRDEGEAYAAALEEAGVPVQLIRYPGLIHHAIMVPALLDLGRRMVEETAARIGAALSAVEAS